MHIQKLKRIFDFLENKENKIPEDKGSFKWRLSFNEPFTKEDLVQKGNLILMKSNIVSFPKELDGLHIKGFLSLYGCKSLTSLPNNLKVDGYLNLSNCTSLTSLPNDLKVGGFLSLANCVSLTTLPNDLKVDGDLNLHNCKSLTSLPNNLNVGGSLYLNKCTSLTSLPNDLKVVDLYVGSTIFAKMTYEEIKSMIPNGYIKGQIVR